MNQAVNAVVDKGFSNLVELKIAKPSFAPTSHLVADAEGMIVDSDFMAEECGEQLRGLTSLERLIEDGRVRVVNPINKSKDEAQAYFKEQSDPVKRAKEILKNKLSAYLNRKRLIAEQKQREENQRAEQERLFLQKQAQEELQKADAIAESASEKSSHELAEQVNEAVSRGLELQTQSELVVAHVVSTGTTKVSGISQRENWRYEVVDASLVPREYLTIDEKKINGVVKAMKGESNIPGIRAYNDPITSVRA